MCYSNDNPPISPAANYSQNTHCLSCDRQVWSLEPELLPLRYAVKRLPAFRLADSHAVPAKLQPPSLACFVL